MAAPTVRARVTPLAGLVFSRPPSTAIGDAMIAFFWEQAGAGIPTHFVESGTGWVEIISHSHDDGSTDGRLSVAYKIATAAGAGGEQPYTSSNGATTRLGVVVLQAGTHSLGATAKGTTAQASASLTNTNPPNPPSVTLGTTRDWLVIAAAGWHLPSAADAIPTVPANYANLQHVAGSSASELATAERSVLAAASEDPAAFADNVTPNGTASVTVALANPVERAAAVGGVGNIGSSGTVVPGIEVHERSAAVAATAAIATSGTVVPGVTVHSRSAAVGATAAIASSATFFSILARSAAVSASAGISSVPQRVLLRSIAASASAGIASAGTFFSILSRSASTNATGTITVSAIKLLPRSASLAASATITTDSERVHLRSALLHATANIASDGSGIPAGVVASSARIDASAGIAVSGVGVHFHSRSASLTATATLTVSGAISQIWVRSVALDAVALIATHGLVPPIFAFEFPVGRAPILVGSAQPRITSAGVEGRIQEPDSVLVEV